MTATDELINRALTLKLRFERSGSRADIDEAIRLGEVAVAAGGPHLDVALGNLSAALLRRFERFADRADIDAAVARGRAAVAAVPEGDPDRGKRWTNLALALNARYQWGREPADLDRAVEAGRAALMENTPGEPSHGRALTNLATMLAGRFERDRDRGGADLDEAIDLARAAAAALREGTQERAAADFNLGRLLTISYQHRNELAALDESIELVRAVAPGDPLALINLAGSLRQRYERTGCDRDLIAAAQALTDALALLPEGHPTLGMLLSELSVVEARRYHASGDPARLDAAVSAARRSVPATPPGHPRFSAHQANLASALQARYERTGELEDLEEAVANARRAESAAGGGPLTWAAAMAASLGGLLRMRYARVGDAADLDEAVAAARRALAAVPEGSPERGGLLTTLCTALRARYLRSGERADIEEAVAAGREALACTPSRHSALARFRLNLAVALLTLFSRTGAAEAELDALGQLETALEEMPAGDPEQGRFLSHLATARRLRAERTGERAGHDLAVHTAERALAVTHPGHPNLGERRYELAVALQARYEHGRDPADLDAAIAAGRDAIEVTPQGYVHRASLLGNLGSALLRRAVRRSGAPWDDETGSAVPEEERDGGAEDALAALALCREAALDEAGTLTSRIGAARHWGRCGAVLGDWAQALAGLETAIGLLPRLAPRDLERADQEHRLAQISGVAAEAAACALENGLPERALELLEAGRGVLYAQALETRPELAGLDPVLATRVERLRRDLDADQAVPAGRRGELSGQWAALVEEIRALPGHAGFAAAPAAAELTAQAEHGPIVVVNVSEYRCDALLVTRDGVRALPLPGLTQREAVARAALFRAARERVAERAGEVHGVLAWLWERVAEPVLAALPGERRVWWIGTGPLALLPLHAAGHHTDGSGRTVLDRVVSSTTPTVRALAHARAAAAQPAEGGTLVVADSRAPRAAELVEPVLAAFPEALSLCDEPPATVLEHLATAARAHFACHGHLDPASPSRSRLQIGPRGDLRLTAVTGLRLRGARLAYLSACGTAEPHGGLADEAIHLAAAFHLAGYANVVATLWPIYSIPAVEVAKVFYADAAHPAEALHRAVLALRADLPGLPALWAPFIHSGV
ncbi:CHAT domain-containing protein [Nonomuraea typhae]|uniref:CHAT domain-containing protein n=1 Tax=Nonomuraea typhae TaxID=2603600 RepID=A0ABW7ZBI7_9ACTN